MRDDIRSKAIAVGSALAAAAYWIVAFVLWIVLVFEVSAPRENNCAAAEATLTCYGELRGISAPVVAVVLLSGGILAFVGAWTAGDRVRPVLRRMVTAWVILGMAVSSAVALTTLRSPEARSLAQQRAELEDRPDLEETVVSYRGLIAAIGARIETRYPIGEWATERRWGTSCQKFPDAEGDGAGSVELITWLRAAAGAEWSEMVVLADEIVSGYGFRSLTGTKDVEVYEAVSQHGTVRFSRFATGRAQLITDTGCLPTGR